jgi:hypothetical protein
MKITVTIDNRSSARAILVSSIALLSALGCDEERLCDQGRCETSVADSSSGSDEKVRSTKDESSTSNESERPAPTSPVRPTPSPSSKTPDDDDTSGCCVRETPLCSDQDAGDERDCSTCDPESHRGCAPERPYCVARRAGEGDVSRVETECVECVDSADCGRGAPVCLENRCVECGRDDDCTTSKASRCELETNQCVPCDGVGQCAHLDQTPVCDVDQRRCVECTREDNAACGARVCNVLEGEKGYHSCSEHEAKTTSVCGECVNDEQCEVGLRCVPEVNPFFSDELTGKYHCLPLERELGGSKICEDNRPFVRPLLTTSEGGDFGTYCRVPYATCTAFLMYGKKPYIVPKGEIGEGDAVCFSDESCGLAGVGDGDCTTLGCTYACDTPMSCPGNDTCAGVCLPGVTP